MSTTLEEALEEVQALPPEEQQQLRELTTNFGEVLLMALMLAAFRKLGPAKLDFGEVRALLEKAASELPKVKELAARRSQRATLSRSIRGKYSYLPTSSEAFTALKREETKLEDSKFRDRQ